jgi:hypothetical protein
VPGDASVCVTKHVPYFVSIVSPTSGSRGSSTSWTSFQSGVSIVIMNRLMVYIMQDRAKAANRQSREAALFASLMARLGLTAFRGTTPHSDILEALHSEGGKAARLYERLAEADKASVRQSILGQLATVERHEREVFALIPSLSPTHLARLQERRRAA